MSQFWYTLKKLEPTRILFEYGYESFNIITSGFGHTH
jgi:hypothetical protein